MLLPVFSYAIATLASVAGATLVSDNPALAADKAFDFVIVGAGLSGLTVGNKVMGLSFLEFAIWNYPLTRTLPKLSGQGHSVLIVEAGPDGSWNPAVWDAGGRPYPAVYCNWNYPRYDDAGKKLNSTIDAGACIGGSTSSESLRK